MSSSDISASPKVSVIIPVYNTSGLIKRCLFSLIRQDFDKDYEMIVINDGSTDDSLEVVKKIAARYDFIRVYSQKNSGVSAARNKGLEYARGKYVTFVDSDDFADVHYISMMYRAAESTGADIVCCNFRSVDECGAPSGIDGILHHRPGVFAADKMLRALLRDITIRSFLWNKLFRRGLFAEHDIKFPVGKLYEDMRTTPKLFYYAEKIVVIGKTLYNYVHHSGSITGTMTPRKVFRYIDSFGSVRKFLDEKRIFPEYASAYRVQGVKLGFTVVPMLIGCKSRDKSLKLAKYCDLAIRKIYRYVV